MKPSVIKPSDSDEFYTPERCHILELLGVEDDADVSIARARVEPGVTTAWHRLAGVHERYIILEGEGVMEVGENDATPVKSGEVVVIPRDKPQRITNNGVRDLTFLCICSPPFRPECYVDLDGEMAT